MKVYIEEHSPLLNYGKSHAFPFAFDSRWEFSSNPEEADIVPLLHFHGQEQYDQLKYFQNIFPQDKKTVLLSVFHDAEDNDPTRFKWFQETYPNITILSTAYNKPWPNVLFYDFLWNRTKGLYGLGYLNKDCAVKSTWLHHFNINMFQRNSGIKHITHNLLIPNRAYYGKFEVLGVRLEKRSELHTIKLKNTLMSNPDKGVIFETDNWNPNYIKEIKKGGVYAPIANQYYNQTFASAYVESVVDTGDNLVKTITEKTWEPLLKGHFIIPFATPGIIDELERRGFKFPDFIDYSYTRETNNDIRWHGFVEQLRKISSLELAKVNTLYEDNVHIIKHNQRLFQTLNYDSLYEKLQ